MQRRSDHSYRCPTTPHPNRNNIPTYPPTPAYMHPSPNSWMGGDQVSAGVSSLTDGMIPFYRCIRHQPHRNQSQVHQYQRYLGGSSTVCHCRGAARQGRQNQAENMPLVLRGTPRPHLSTNLCSISPKKG